MGAGNPRFADMERYRPETFYIEAYNYDEDFEFVLEDSIKILQDELKDLGFEPEDPRDLHSSDNVNMCGFREEALVLFGHEYAQICIGTESTSDKIVLSIVPLDFGVLEDLYPQREDYSYDDYIELEFEPLKEQVMKILYHNYKGKIYFPTSAWTSRKLELKDEDKEY